MTVLPSDIQEIEADLFQIFTGWAPSVTEVMSVAELLKWHAIAIERHNKEQEARKGE